LFAALGFDVAPEVGTAALTPDVGGACPNTRKLAACASGGILLFGGGFRATGGVADLDAPVDVFTLLAALESFAPLFAYPSTGT
jgi:hypothetical protein